MRAVELADRGARGTSPGSRRRWSASLVLPACCDGSQCGIHARPPSFRVLRRASALACIAGPSAHRCGAYRRGRRWVSFTCCTGLGALVDDVRIAHRRSKSWDADPHAARCATWLSRAGAGDDPILGGGRRSKPAQRGLKTSRMSISSTMPADARARMSAPVQRVRADRPAGPGGGSAIVAIVIPRSERPITSPAWRLHLREDHLDTNRPWLARRERARDSLWSDHRA